jgi:cysteine desulfurase
MTIYLDYQATTPTAPEVAAAMRPWLEERFGNPHSPHRLGREAAAAIEVARGHVLRALATPLPAHREAPGVGVPSENALRAETDPPLTPPCVQGGEGHLYFTSGATEAANWGLKGAAWRLPAGKRRIVMLATEHACVLDTVEWLGLQGFEFEILPVGADGIFDLDLAA